MQKRLTEKELDRERGVTPYKAGGFFLVPNQFDAPINTMRVPSSVLFLVLSVELVGALGYHFEDGGNGIEDWEDTRPRSEVKEVRQGSEELSEVKTTISAKTYFSRRCKSLPSCSVQYALQ